MDRIFTAQLAHFGLLPVGLGLVGLGLVGLGEVAWDLNPQGPEGLSSRVEVRMCQMRSIQLRCSGFMRTERRAVSLA